MNNRNFQLILVRSGIFCLIALLVACSPASSALTEVTAGSSKEDVIALYGEPDRRQEFLIPDEPFFGPQEGLIDLVAPGTLVEEWVYEIGDEELYIWFAGESEDREAWRVLALGRYPKDAVY
jgi:hypothetical protein